MINNIIIIFNKINMGAIDDAVESIMKEPESNKRRRLYLTQKLKRDFEKEHERNERAYRRYVHDYNNEMRRLHRLPDDNPDKHIMIDLYNGIYDIHSNQRQRQNELYYNMHSELKEAIRRIITNEEEREAKKYAKKIIKQAVSVAIGFVPVLGNAKGIVDTILGRDLITDEELNHIERVYAGLSSLPVVGDYIGWENWVTKIISKLFAL